MRRPVLDFSSPRSIRSQSGSTVGRRAHPTHCPRLLESAARPHLPLLRAELPLPGLSKNQVTESAKFSSLGDTRYGSAMGVRSSDRGGGGVTVRSPGKRGPCASGGCACPRADSLCDRMERGEEEANTAAAMHLRSPILQTLRPVGFRRATAENFRPEIFEARATLRRAASGVEPLVCPKPRVSHRTPQSVPVCQESRNVPIYLRSLEISASASPCSRKYSTLMFTSAAK